MRNKTDVDIVLPCYNPSAGWEKEIVSNLKQIKYLFHDICFHLYIVNNGLKRGFTNESVAYICNEFPATTIISYPNNQGKGYAVRKGIKATTSKYVIYTDCDFPYTLDSF